MKKVLLLTICLVFVFAVGTAFASAAPPIDKCKCTFINVKATGNVMWFCCLMADGKAKVNLIGQTGILYASGKTKADGTFKITGKVAAQICQARPKCCIITDCVHIETYSCVCVVGNKGKSACANVVVLSPCQKSVDFKFGTICEDFTPCGDC